MKPDRGKFLKAKRSLIRWLRKSIAESEQLTRDLESWNDNRTDCAPFDVGGQKVFTKLAKEMLAVVESNQRIPTGMYEAVLKQAEELSNV